ncbi:hypothetical protein ACIG8S_04590 [[Kitasatospora] papulosa]|uniref:hypothetical protein n=1 Tax=[Kitasatospora] papulosa TaxID=1464011 RepID=UPI0037D148DC
MHLLTGGPAWEQRKVKLPQQAKFTKRQKEARKPVLKLMRELEAALKKRDWRAARAARSAAWDEVGRLADDLTREERKKLWECKHLITAGEDQDRRRRAAG